MEYEHLFKPQDGENEINNLRIGSEYLDHQICSCIPKRKTHYLRGSIAIQPSDKLMRLRQFDENGNEIYIDSSRRRWIQIAKITNKDFISMKCYDKEVIETGRGSSQIEVIKMSDDDLIVVSKTYNFRDIDHSGCLSHFLADILPKCLYCGSSKTFVTPNS